MRILSRLLAFCLICSTVAEEAAVYASVKKYTDHWNAVSTGEDNGLVALEKVSKNAQLLLELGRPVSAVIIAGFKVEWKNETDEQLAITLLDQEMSRQIEKEQLRNQGVDVSSVSDFEFIDEVTLKLDIFAHKYRWATSPRLALREVDMDMKDGCSELKTVVKRLESMFIKRCKLPTVASQKRYLQIMEAIHNIERGFPRYDREHPLYKWKTAVDAVKSRIHFFTDEEATGVLWALLKARGSSESAAADILEAFSSKFHNTGGYFCRSIALFDVGDHKRKAQFNMLSQLAYEFKRVLIFTTACSNLTQRGQTNFMDQYERKIVDYITRISDYVIELTKQVLDRDWPTGPATFAKHELMLTVGSSINVSSHNRSAAILRKNFDERGHEELSSQILVIRPMKSTEEFHLLSVHESNHTLLSDFLGVDVHVFRHNSSDRERAKRAAAWFETKRESLITGFKRLTDTQPSYSASERLDYLDLHAESLVANDLFHHAILFSTQSYNAENAILHVGEAIDLAIPRAGKAELYQNFPFYYRDFSYKLYLFV